MLELILSLTPMDYDHLARAVQVEAATGTKDEYCVAVSILNRVRPAAKQSVIARLKNNDNLMNAYSIIGDRTDFKGQTMLRYRVTSEDPMCDTRGNFYHYYWQT